MAQLRNHKLNVSKGQSCCKMYIKVSFIALHMRQLGTFFLYNFQFYSLLNSYIFCYLM